MSSATLPRAVRSQEKKDLIYRTAMMLFKHRGYGNTTIRDICREANVSNGTFYHFFGDKSGVLLEFFDQICVERNNSLSPTAEHLEHPFQTVYDYLIRVAALQDLIGKDLTRETMYSDPYVLAARHLTATRISGMRQIAQFLQAAIDAGKLPADLDPRDTAEYLLTGSSGVIFNWITLSEEESVVHLMRRLLPVIFSAVTEEPLDTDREPVLVSMKNERNPMG